jgi:hypothetical protein
MTKMRIVSQCPLWSNWTACHSARYGATELKSLNNHFYFDHGRSIQGQIVSNCVLLYRKVTSNHLRGHVVETAMKIETCSFGFFGQFYAISIGLYLKTFILIIIYKFKKINLRPTKMSVVHLHINHFESCYSLIVFPKDKRVKLSWGIFTIGNKVGTLNTSDGKSQVSRHKALILLPDAVTYQFFCLFLLVWGNTRNKKMCYKYVKTEFGSRGRQI